MSLTSKVRTYLEGFFLAGNVDKADRMSAKDMAMELKKLGIRVENNETNKRSKRSENCSENIQQK
nr:3075_t:CDS:2 [Entrophospora candida]